MIRLEFRTLQLAFLNKFRQRGGTTKKEAQKSLLQPTTSKLQFKTVPQTVAHIAITQSHPPDKKKHKIPTTASTTRFLTSTPTPTKDPLVEGDLWDGINGHLVDVDEHVGLHPSQPAALVCVHRRSLLRSLGSPFDHTNHSLKTSYSTFSLSPR